MVELVVISQQVVALKGELNTISAAEAETKFDALRPDLSKQIAFDLSDLTYISSSGLRFLLSVKKKAKALGGDILVIDMSEAVEKIFKVVGFDALFCPQ